MIIEYESEEDIRIALDLQIRLCKRKKGIIALTIKPTKEYVEELRRRLKK